MISNMISIKVYHNMDNKKINNVNVEYMVIYLKFISNLSNPPNCAFTLQWTSMNFVCQWKNENPHKHYIFVCGYFV